MDGENTARTVELRHPDDETASVTIETSSNISASRFNVRTYASSIAPISEDDCLIEEGKLVNHLKRALEKLAGFDLVPPMTSSESTRHAVGPLVARWRWRRATRDDIELGKAHHVLERSNARTLKLQSFLKIMLFTALFLVNARKSRVSIKTRAFKEQW